MVLSSKTGPKRHCNKVYTPVDLQRTQVWEEKANEAITILEANASVLGSIMDYYLALAKNSSFPLKDSSEHDIAMFVGQMRDLIADSNMQRSRAKLLVNIASQRKTLVRLRHVRHSIPRADSAADPPILAVPSI